MTSNKERLSNLQPLKPFARVLKPVLKHKPFARVFGPARVQHALSGPKRSAKRVSFAPDTKRHDGLKPSSDIIDTLVDELFNHRTIKKPEDIIVVLTALGWENLLFDGKKKVSDEFHRIYYSLLKMDAESNDKVIVLPEGGGKNTLLGKCHVSGMRELIMLTREAIMLMKKEAIGIV